MTLLVVPERQARVGARLVALREELGLSQEEAVARTEGAVTLRQWQRWESGESEPYKRNLAKLSETFNIPIGEFFGETAPPPKAQLDRIEAKLDKILGRLGPTDAPPLTEMWEEALAATRPRDDVPDEQRTPQAPHAA